MNSKTLICNSAKGIWLITFGDVLTLLLCFVLISSNGLDINKHSNSAVRYRKSSEKMNKISSSSLHKYVGIPIAHYEGEENYDEHFILFEDGDDLSEINLPPLLKSELSSGFYKDSKVKKIEVEVCFQPNLGEIWFNNLNLSSGIQRQLFDLGITADLLKFQMLGDRCSLIQGSSHESAIGRIRVYF